MKKGKKVRSKQMTEIKVALECQGLYRMQYPFLIARPLGLTTEDHGHSQDHLLAYHLSHRP